MAQNIWVTDKLMGTGKTHVKLVELKQDIIDNPDKKYIYVVVTRDEIKRVQKDCSDVFITPTCGETDDGIETYFMTSFKELAKQKKNIVTTHSLFLKLTREDTHLLKGYNLVLDEVPSIIDIRKEKSGDINEFYENGTILIDDNKKVSWNSVKKDYTGALSKLKGRIEKGTISAAMTEKNKVLALVWNYPQEIFRAFDSVEVLTYLFEESLFKAYLRIHGFSYSMPISYTEHLFIQKVKSFITVYDGDKLNEIGDGDFDLSQNWFVRDKKKGTGLRHKLKQNTVNFFRQEGTKSIQNAFSVYVDYQTDIEGRGYTKYKFDEKKNEKVNECFIAINARATNDYSHKTTIAYLINRLYDKRLLSYFNQNNVKVSQDGLALSELVQLIFRGNIRNMNKIYADGTPVDASMMLYIPSKRMRDLFTGWLSQTQADVRRYRNSGTKRKNVQK